MATFTNTLLTIDNFLPIQEYKEGMAKMTKTMQKLNIFNNKLSFLRNTYNCTQITLNTTTYLPNLSYVFYETTSLWWVIGMFNGIIYPFIQIAPGTVLYIPNFAEINSFLGNTSNNNKAINRNSDYI